MATIEEIAEATICDPKPLIWTTELFMRAAEAGAFDEKRVELVEGEVLEKTPASPRHTTSLLKVAEALRASLGAGQLIRCQAPVSILETSQPEPDVAVVSGEIDDYDDRHPNSTLLIVEVADTTLRFDRGKKAKIYSKAKLQEYWIVNLNADQIEVFRQPDGEGDFAEKFIVKRGDRISPVGAPNAVIEVEQLLPKSKSSFGG
jgi:Uma2 family endonuclease